MELQRIDWIFILQKRSFYHVFSFIEKSLIMYWENVMLSSEKIFKLNETAKILGTVYIMVQIC